MPAESVQIGPFVGGLNTFSDVTSIADNELAVCENFDLDLDGSLVSRPPISYKNIDLPLQETGNPETLGIYRGPGGVSYILASDGNSKTYYFSGSSWTLLTDTFAASAMAQFDGKAWLVAPETSTNPGGYWTPTGGFTAEANMPKGDVIASHKFRLWIGLGQDALDNTTRMYYSEVLGAPTFWLASPNFVDIGAGDGQSIVQIAVYYNTLMVFRTGSIFSFQYTSDPAQATVSQVVPGVGLSNKHAIVTMDNYMYFTFEDRAYEFINSRATQINRKVPFDSTSRSGIYAPASVSVFGRRILFSYWNSTFVFSPQTRTWTTWISPTHGPLGMFSTVDVDAEEEESILFSARAVVGATRAAKTLHIQNGFGDATEDYVCTMRTKNYSYESSSIYKRLFWWGVDAIFRGAITGTADPVVQSYQVTWADLLLHKVEEVRKFYWDRPISKGLSVETIRDASGSSASRKFAKMRKGLRFRQIGFQVSFETDGTSSSAPVRLFSLTTYVRAHEKVSKAIT